MVSRVARVMVPLCPGPVNGVSGGLPDAERRVAGGGGIGDGGAVDRGAGRPGAQPGEHLIHSLRRPFDLSLHAAVPAIAGPAGHAQVLRGLAGAPAEADALDAPGHDGSSADHSPIVLLVRRGTV